MTATDLITPDVSVGESRELVLTEDLTRTQLVMYAGAAGDFHPVHTDERFAREALGMPGVFGHGMLTMGMTARAVTDWVGADKLLTYGARFKAQVWPGDRLTATVTVTGVRDTDQGKVVDLDVVTVNADGAQVISGYASALLD